jgi:hypothetical protein
VTEIIGICIQLTSPLLQEVVLGRADMCGLGGAKVWWLVKMSLLWRTFKYVSQVNVER